MITDWIVGAGAGVGGLYTFCCAWLIFGQARHLYFPTTEVRQTPADIGLAFEDVALRTEDGETVRAWFVPAPGGAADTVLFCHGNGGNRGDRLFFIRLLNELGVNVLLFDYRGYGGSSGRPGEAGTYRDAQAAWRHLVDARGIPAARIVVFGRSLGGAVAAWLAERETPGGLILESTFTSVPDMAAAVYPWLPARWLCRFRYDTRARMARIRCPVLVMHSPDDRTVPFEQGRRVFEAANEPKTFLAMTGTHNDGFEVTGAAYREALAVFLAAVRDGRGH